MPYRRLRHTLRRTRRAVPAALVTVNVHRIQTTHANHDLVEQLLLEQVSLILAEQVQVLSPSMQMRHMCHNQGIVRTNVLDDSQS
jgi:hypothetical protein